MSIESKERARLMALNLQEKINHAKKIIRQALTRSSRDDLYLAWTGHKDSTTMLWLFRETCREIKSPLPRTMLIDDGFLFDEALSLMEHVKRLWDVKVLKLKNRDVTGKTHKVGDSIEVSALNTMNRLELENFGFRDDAFIFSPDSIVCTHLMKTAVLKQFVENSGVKALSTAIRWDEHEARGREKFFSPRANPDHMRIHPMLHFTERDIWDIIQQFQIPVCSLYERGYRSLGAKESTSKTSDIPRWEQDLESAPERAERDKEKEEIMARLRAIGYI